MVKGFKVGSSDCCFLNSQSCLPREVVSSLKLWIFKPMTEDLAVVCGRFEN